MEYFKILGLLLLISFITNASCYYEEGIQINDVYLSTINPELGTFLEINIEVESEEFSTNTLRIFMDEGHYTQLLIEEEVYLSRGINKFKYEVKISESIGHNIGLIEVKVGSKSEKIPIIINNIYTGLIQQYETDKFFTLNIESDTPIKFEIKNEITRIINSRPINGTITLNIERCEKCEMIVFFEYKGDKYNIYKNYGEYTKPYLRIKEIENRKIKFVSCPERNIESKIFESGYEVIKIEDYNFDLNKFLTQELNEIEILNNKPLNIRITATDELQRNVRSSGILFIECETINFMNDIEFIGIREYTYDLGINTTCNLSYGNANVKTEVFAREKIEIIEEEEIRIYWEDYILYGLIVLVIIITGMLLNKWRSLRGL